MDFSINEETAEFYGALLGDGCVSKYWKKSKSRWRFEIAFTGSINDWQYYIDFIQPCCVRWFGVKGRLFQRNRNSTRFHISNKELALTLNRIGFPFGKKPDSLSIPDIFLSNEDLSKAVLRGIFNTDGSIYRLYKRKYGKQKRVYSDYRVIQLKMRAKPIIQQAKKILSQYGIHTGKILFEEPGKSVLRICSKQAVSLYLKEIGFSNKAHLDRIASF